MSERMQKQDFHPVYSKGDSINDYVVEDVIFFGSNSEIYTVWSSKYNMTFVLKLIRIMNTDIQKAWNAFNSEIISLQRLDHDNVIRLYDHFHVSDMFFIVLEYCCGGTLADAIVKNGCFPFHRFLQLSLQIVKAIMHSHEQGVAHHDIKPQNILFDGYGRVKLADFGISIFSEQTKSFNNRNYSPVFVAPEILEKHDYSPFVADIYSLGVTLFVCATGRVATSSTSRREIADNLASFKEYHQGKTLINMIIKMMNDDPNKRPNVQSLYQLLVNISIEECSMPLKSIKTKISKRSNLLSSQIVQIHKMGSHSRFIFLKNSNQKLQFI